MSVNRGMDKEDVLHIYNGILLSHYKEQNCAICRDVDGPRVYHTEWSKSEREKQTLHINANTWNLEKWYRGTYFQGRNRDSDKENRHVDTGHRGGWDELGYQDWHICTTMCKIGDWWEAATQREQRSSMLYDDPEGSEGVRVGGRFKKEGKYAYLQLIHCWAAEPTPHCKVIIPQFYKALWKENQQDSVTDETEPFMMIKRVWRLQERLHWWLSGKESACQCRRHRFNPWSPRKIPHAVEQLRVGTTTTEAQVPQSPCSSVREATAKRGRCTAPRE